MNRPKTKVDPTLTFIRAARARAQAQLKAAQELLATLAAWEVEAVACRARHDARALTLVTKQAA